MSTTMTTAVERYRPVMSDAKQATLLGFLAGCRGYTRDACTSDPGAPRVSAAARICGSSVIPAPARRELRSRPSALHD